MNLLSLNDTVFRVLDFSLTLSALLIIFLILAIICLIIYFVVLFRKNSKFYFEKEEVSANEFKRLEKFEEQRNDFELELAKIKKMVKDNKK